MRNALRISTVLSSLALLAVVAGCDRAATTQSSLPTTRMAVGSKTYTLEVAAQMHDRNTGLMYRDSMPEDHGMIFVFAGEEKRDFWMKNTRIPLDILFVDAGGRIVSIHRMEPYVERPATESKGPAKYAIELNAGQAAAAGVKEGEVLKLPDEVKNAKADPAP